MDSQDKLSIDPMLEEQEINLLDLLQVVVKRKMLIIKLCVAAGILSIAYSLTLPNIYSATAKVLPPQKETGGGGLSAILGQMGGLAGMAGISGIGGSGELFLSILKSRSVADGVIEKLDLKTYFKVKNPDAARAVLTGAVKSQLGKDGIITVTAESKDPKQAAALANAMVDELGKRTVQLNLTKVGVERSFLEKRIEMVKNDLKKAEDDLRLFSEQNKTIKVESQATATISEVAKLKADIASREVQLAGLRSYQTEESPEVKTLKSSIAKLQSQMQAGEGSGGGGLIPAVGKVPSLGLEYARRLREVKIQEAIFEQLAKQYEAAKLMEAKDSSSLQVLDEAVVPARKSKPERSLIVILSTVTAFFLGVFGAFLLEYAEKMSPEDRTRWEEIKSQLRLSRTSRASLPQ